MLLGRSYIPAHGDALMRGPDDVAGAREAFLRHRPSNLKYLLHTRYTWVNDHLTKGANVVELGAGAGLSREFLAADNLILTDYTASNWIDLRADARRLPFKDNCVDILLCFCTIHHFSNVVSFFAEAHRVMRDGGLLIIHEAHASLLMRLVLRLMRHEGWSFDVDVFSEKAILNDPHDPWSGNNAVGDLLFSDPGRFEARLPGFKIQRNELCECLIFLLSGGVTAKSFTINLPTWALRMIDKLDAGLTPLAPGIFPLCRRIVLEKRSPGLDAAGVNSQGGAFGVIDQPVIGVDTKKG
jgi:SAM-dependent methyltransferase